MEPLPLELLLSPEFMLKTIRVIHSGIHRYIQMLPALAFTPYFFDTGSGLKQLTWVDLEAERTFIKTVTAKFGANRVMIIGEETLTNVICLTSENRRCLLVDMIDGTDLLQRNFGNWCSAIVVFDPRGPEILAAFVAVPAVSGPHDGFLYYATKEGAFKVPLKAKGPLQPIALRCSRPKKLFQDSSVCMYAQKNNNFESLVALQKKKKFVKWLKGNHLTNRNRHERKEEELQFRFYDFAGNPMMVRMCDDTVDVVFDLNGQSPHDVVPGAYIALKAGAVMGTIDGSPLTEEHLAESLLRPGDSPLKYILAANQEMYLQLSQLLT